MSIIDKLVSLVEQLYEESENYIQNPSDVQLWYNRGYANGIVSFLNTQNYSDRIKYLSLDTESSHKDEHVMEWHKAYHHGFEMGLRESVEIAK